MSLQQKRNDHSPWYAPECRESELAPTAAVDIWCVGMTALELSIGVIPQDGQLSAIHAFIEGPDTIFGGSLSRS